MYLGALVEGLKLELVVLVVDILDALRSCTDCLACKLYIMERTVDGLLAELLAVGKS